MANNTMASYQPRSTTGSVTDVLQQIHRMNPGSMGGLMGRGGGYNPSNTSMLGQLNTPFSGNSGGGTFPPGVADSAPSPLDLSEFPSLGGRTGTGMTTLDATPHPHVSGRPGSYSGLNHSWGGIKPPTSEPSEFTMSNEDFPALPGTNKQQKLGGSQQHQQQGDAFSDKKGGGVSTPSGSALSGVSDEGSVRTPSSQTSAADKNSQSKRGIQTSLDGKVTNIPKSMVRDQFGMVGLLTFIRAAENETNLVSLALGSDLTSLGLNLNSPENLYPTFGGPWAESPCRPQDIDYHVPQEYLVNQQISNYSRMNKVPPISLEKYGEDLLFYIFYTNTGDVLQIMAAAELYGRDWRYHKEEQVWITRAPGMPPTEKGPTFERGTYFYFDVQNWRKVPKEFHLIYDKLDNQPLSLPTHNSLKIIYQQQGQTSTTIPQQQSQQQQQQHLNHHAPSSALA